MIIVSHASAHFPLCCPSDRSTVADIPPLLGCQTIEPGCYFSPHLLAPIRNSPHIDHEVLKRYESVGGVRIEDVVVVEENGVRNLTPAVRERADVERLCSGN